MTKSTKAKITLIFTISKKASNLSKSLDAIARQTDKDVNLIFVFNGAGPSEKDIFKKFEFNGFNKIEYIFLSENLGDSYVFNYVDKHNLQTKYVYQFDSNITLMPDFIAILNKFLQLHPESDIISFFGVPNIYFKEEYLQIKTLSDDFCNRPLISFNNKLLNVEYLHESNIVEPKFKHYPLFFYVMLIKNNPKWYSLGRQICSISQNPFFTYNVLDLFDQCQEIINVLDKKVYSDHYSEIEYLCIVSLFRNFIYAIFKENRTNFFLQKRILNKVEDFVDCNFPNWERNEWLYSKKNKNDETYLQYLREFKPRLIHVLRALYSKLFVQGHAKRH